MKKVIALLLAAVLVLALAGCGAAKEPEKEPEADEPFTGMANPWSEVKTAAEAGKGAGVGEFQLPEGVVLNVGPLAFTEFRWMDGLAHADGSAGAATISVRKGLTAKIGEDVSGDYTEYAETWTQDVDGQTVTCKGNVEDQAMDVLWSAGDYSYCIYVRGQGDDDATFGLGGEDVAALVAAIG